MKQNVLQILKCIDKNPKRVKSMIQIIAQISRQSIGKQKCGRKRVKLAYVIAGILYYMRTGCSWRALPDVFGNHKTIYGWYRRLTRQEIFKEGFESAIKSLLKAKKISIRHILTDGSLVTTMAGGSLAKKNPRNHNKSTINRIIAVNNNGIPLSLALVSGTAHDSQFLVSTIDGIDQKYGLPNDFFVHADKGFDSTKNRFEISQRKGRAFIPLRDHWFAPDVPCPKLNDKNRWKVERSISWFNSFKSLRTIFIRCMDSLLQLYYLAAIMILSRKFSLRILKSLNWRAL